MNSEYDAVIIGAGACGLMVGVQAGYLGKKVLILEKSSQIGSKILISGGGRCNYTNVQVSSENFISANPHFSKSAFSQWSSADTISFFEVNGISGKEKTLGQLFPDGKNAKDVVAMFGSLNHDLNQEIICNAEIQSIKKLDANFLVNYLNKGEIKEITVPKIVITTGGLPIPKMGATDFAFQIAKQFGIAVTKTFPALVPLTIGFDKRDWYASLSGISIFCRVSNEHISFDENILFTHWGLSGPAVLQISSYWKQSETINIDFLPDQFIDQIISEEKLKNGKRTLNAVLGDHLPKKFLEGFAANLPLSQTVSDLSKVQIELINELIHYFEVAPAGDKGYEKAEVMRGGIDTNELSSKTLESKKIPGLYFGGECVDVTGWLGGYNFEWAWASGFVIAQNI